MCKQQAGRKSYISLLASSQEKMELKWWRDIKIKHHESSKGPCTHKNGLQTVTIESVETSLHVVVSHEQEYNRECRYHSRKHGNIRRQQGGITRRRSRMQKMTFLHEKYIKTSDSFFKTHNEMMIHRQYIAEWEQKASPVPFVMQRHSWWVVAGGGRRTRGGVHKWAILAFWEAPLEKSLPSTFM
jgi:hypothetical protein